MRRFLPLVALSLLGNPLPAAAEGLPVPPPGEVIIAADGRTVISSTLCPKLRAEAPGVPGADYRPGVDVHGAAVAPADLPPEPAAAGANIAIEIRTDLRRHFGADAKGFAGRMVMGRILFEDGRATFNGEALSGAEEADMIAACARMKR